MVEKYISNTMNIMFNGYYLLILLIQWIIFIEQFYPFKAVFKNTQ